MTQTARFLFHGRLRRLLAPADPDGVHRYRFTGAPAIKDAIEALGVPHTEVDLIIADGRAVGFDYRLQGEQQIEVAPCGVLPDTGPLLHLSPPVPENPAFIIDVHLGKLARRLRILGFDCRYRNDYSDSRLIELALAEGLIILTRDRGILKWARVRQGYLVGSCHVEEQVCEVLERYLLYGRLRPFCRCPQCNGLLEDVDKESIRHRLLPDTARYYQHFQRCGCCERLYWQGSHYATIVRWVARLAVSKNPGFDTRRG